MGQPDIKLRKSALLFFIMLFCGSSFSYAITFAETTADQSPVPGVLRISTFDVDATPPVGSKLTYDPMLNSGDLSLRAKGVVIQGSGKPIVLCAIDWIGIANESQDAFKLALAEAAGTIPERVAVHTLHQHDAPICDFTAEKILKEHNMPPGCFDGTFARELIKKIQQSIRTTIGNAQPVTHIGMGKADVYKVASNRRVDKKDGKVYKMRGSSCKDSTLRALPEGLIDPKISLVSFWNSDQPVAVLSFYATHPQSYYLTQIANPDFPGIARFMRQLAVPDALHIHFNGAGGNVAAGKYNDGSHETRLILAERMADGMKRAWENTKRFAIEAKDVQWLTEPMFLPYRDETAAIEQTMSQMDERTLANNLGRLGWYKRRQEGKNIEAACLVAGDARMLFLPGELFIEYQLNAKSMAPDKFVTMAAYGDYGPFYIGTKEAYSEGGYEIVSSPVSDEAEACILNAIRILLQKAGHYDGLLIRKDDKGNFSHITTVKGWEQRRKDVLNDMQKVMGPLPKKIPSRFRIHYTDSLTSEFYTRYSINFEVAPSERVYAYLYRPRDNNRKHPAVLTLQSTGLDGKKIIDDDTPLKNRGYAKELAQRGYVVISPDYPSFGELKDYDFKNDRYNSGTMKGIFNHICCVSLLQSLPYVDKENIGVIGLSLGGHNAIFVAAFDPRIKVTVSSCGWTLMDYYNAGEATSKHYGGRMGPWAQDRYMPFVRTRYGLDSKQLPFDFDDIIASIAPRAFFSISPLYDENFSVEGVRKAVENIGEVYDFMKASDNFSVIYPSCGHEFLPAEREQAYLFIDKTLKKRE